jgi:hypothetical protein
MAEREAALWIAPDAEVVRSAVGNARAHIYGARAGIGVWSSRGGEEACYSTHVHSSRIGAGQPCGAASFHSIIDAGESTLKHASHPFTGRCG